MTEREFIIQHAINRFNLQYNKKLSIDQCDVKSITPNHFSTLAYEVFTTRLDDFVRLRIYLNFGRYDNLGPYRLEVDSSNNFTNSIGDEVYVASGNVDRYYKHSGLYKFHTLYEDITRWNVLLLENGAALLTEEGDFLLL